MQVITRFTSISATIFFMSGEIIPYHGWGIPVLILISILGIVAFIISYKNADKIQDWFVNLFKKKEKNNILKYMFSGNDRVKKYEDFTPQAKQFLESMKALSKEVYPHPKLALISTGPDMEDTLVL